MPNSFWAWIKFPVARINKDIREALEAVGVRFDRTGRLLQVKGFVEVNDGIFMLEDSQADEGAFKDLEDTLKNLCVPYDLKTEGYIGHSAEIVLFRPGNNGEPPRELCFSNVEGEPVVQFRLSELQDLMAQGYEAIKSYVDKKFPSYLPLNEYLKGV